MRAFLLKGLMLGAMLVLAGASMGGCRTDLADVLQDVSNETDDLANSLRDDHDRDSFWEDWFD